MFLLACLFIGIGLANAQVSRVTGTVTSDEDGLPVVGATVVVKGTSVGTVTDMDGKYTINNVPSSAKTLVFSYIGMKTEEAAIKSTVNMVLLSDSETLDEVVVTAMGIKRSEKALGYSATSVKGDELAQYRSNDVMSSLAGKVAGVSISSTSSDPGSSNSVVIRGFSSLSGSNQPLYIVDGVPLNNSSVSSSDGLNSGYDFGNGANAVNPDDVESMTVLKGAAATALYGSRASNGVILITTKSGKAQNKGIGIEYNGGLQFETLLRVPQMQNDFGMGWYGSKTDDENGSWGPRFDGSQMVYGSIYNNSQNIKSYVPIKNNLKDFFDTGIRYSNSVSFNGATDASTYFVSFSQNSDDGIIPSNKDTYDKYTFSARASHKIKSLTFSTSMNYAYQQNKFVSTGQGGNSMYNAVMQTPRDISIAEMKDLSNPFNTPGYYYTPYGITNPYWVIENYKNQYTSERFYGKFQVDYDFLNYFKASYRLGLDTTTGHQEYGSPNLEKLAEGTYLGINEASTITGATGSVSQSTTRQREINHDLMVTYNQTFGDFGVNGLLGFSANERRYSYLYSAVTNLTIPTFYDLSNSSERPSTSQYYQLRRFYGVYGQAEASWKNMLFLTVTARNDWSSTLPVGNRSFFYPGVTGSFVFTELLNDDAKKVLTFGKVRAAWGKTGNDASPYMTQSVFAQASSSSSGWGSSSFPFAKTGTNAYTNGNTLGSTNLSPEMTTESEVGLQLAFFNNRLSFDAAYYNRISDKQIFSLDMDPATGYTAQNMNLGKIRNRGIELLVNVTPVQTRDFQWDLTWNFTKNKNKVVDLPDALGGQTEIYGLSGGTGLYAMEGGEMGEFWGYTSEKTPDGKVVVDGQGLPTATTDLKYLGSMNHKYSMGFGTTLSYKGVSLQVDFDYRKGGVMYSRTASISYFTGNAIQTAFNDRNPFIVPNSVYGVLDTSNNTWAYYENTTPLDPTAIYNYFNNGGRDRDAGFLVSKTYLKLRSVVLSWTLPSKWLRNTFLSEARISAYGNNLFLWTPKSNTFIDPEATSFGNDLSGNYGEYSANPSSRSFGFNVMVKF